MITGLLHAHPGMFKEFQLHTQVEQLIEKLSQFANVSNNMPLLVSTNQNIHSYRNDGWDHLDDFVQNIAMRNSKQVKLVVSGLSELALDVGYQKKLKEICIQLLRNAVVHGIETPAVRALSEKPLIARIDLRLAKVSDTEMELMVMDDGRGLDYAAIRTKALQSGKWPDAEIKSWTNKQLLGLIFHDGFSAAAGVNKDAGRGVGMETVMNHVLSQHGKINVSSRSGHHCRFVITLPIVPTKVQANNNEEIAASI